jgi:hypothetical protein
MAVNKYEKYIVREPLGFNIFPPYAPRLLFDSKNHFPEMGFGIRYTYITEPIDMERPHAHDFDQFFCFMGAPEDMRIFDGEVELYLGEESTKNIINTTTVVYVPKGMVHCPIRWTRVGRPMMFVNIVLSPQYTRTVQSAEFHNSLELTARKVSLTEAGRIIGVAVPLPAYLPEKYKIQEVYIQDDLVRLFISDTALSKRQLTLGDAEGTRQKYMFECKMELGIRWHSGGKKDALKLAGDRVAIGEAKGILTDRETHQELWWLLPARQVPGQAGQFEIALSISKGFSRDELIRVAGSVNTETR